ncbi:MAG: FAD-binding oxidoreductase, partial [Bacteroidota bacterium]
MKNSSGKYPWHNLASQLVGDLCWDEAHRILYATDASVYREKPLAVAFPKTEEDIVACVLFARRQGLSITPRAGGTSLAGQAIGAGLVVDLSRFMRQILEINPEAGYAIVEPGVVRDQLNAVLAPLGFWFGPNTSTANRCTLGGMFGNNSCGSTSITVGSTREHVLAARVVLSDGSVVEYGPGPRDAVEGTEGQGKASYGLSHKIERHLHELLVDPKVRRNLEEAYPKRQVTRRNTGYALDLLARQHPFTPAGPPFNLCTLLAGSEGTLALTTQLTVRILPLPPSGSAVLALHYTTIDGAMRATQRVMRHQPFMCELMDDTILRLARTNPEQARNAAFVEGDPRALLLVEFRASTDVAAADLAAAAAAAEATAYAAPILQGAEAAAKVWKLRAAGLGILGNIVGDAKAVACIEDTAVAIEDLADYIAEVTTLMELYQQNPVYYAHAGAGEIHLRPILNLKTSQGR